ncbi:nodulation protein NodH [Paenirhodobacter sp.]|uniref:nodulation protein NodH n=1 Tax=Paenirhodobacter sp. TaxID=1965326 RepID=UPI003B3FFFE8
MPHFESFVVLAGMRTGSNLLEAALNALPGVTCHGEAFNPALIGYPKRSALLGMTRAERDADPLALWARIKAAPGLNGCRYFHDHDPRLLAPMLADPACAKIVLTRNPVESYVSLQIARATGQWKLGDARNRKSVRAEFDPAGFEAHLAAVQGFQIHILHGLQTSGQSAFYVDYDDLQDLEVLNGLAAWLGVEGRLAALPDSLVVQNPEPIEAKVGNFAQMSAALARLDRFNLSRTPNFEPRRGPNVPGFLAAGGLLYMPLRPDVPGVAEWLAGLGPVERGFSQKTLRQWKRRHPGHRSFTVLRHPLLRAHLALHAVLTRDDMGHVRDVLRESYRLALGPEALEPFLGWIKANLNGQTSLPVSPLWASQSALMQGLGQFATPDLIAREEDLPRDLGWLAPGAPAFTPLPDPVPALIPTPALQKAAREAYPRDFMQFGFGEYQAA